MCFVSPCEQIRDRQQVALLRPRRHAGRRTDALNVEEHAGNLRVVREPDELAHQRDARAGGRRERARAGPSGADHHAAAASSSSAWMNAYCCCSVSGSTRYARRTP